MRPLLFIALACGIVGCGDNNSSSDMSAAADLSAGGGDLSGAPDMTAIMPFNMPGTIFCYDTNCMTSNASMKVCCDSKNPDGGFVDSCVASAGACTATDPMAKTFECGQAADCGTGKVCCGSIGMSSSGKKFFNSTTCAASCTSMQTQLCVTASECTSSTAKCVGQVITGRAVGLCQ